MYPVRQRVLSLSRPWESIRISAYKAEVLSVKFHPKGSLVAATGNYISCHGEHQRGRIALWNLNIFHCDFLTCHSGAITDLCFSSDGTHLHSASVDTTISHWDLITKQEIQTFTGPSACVNSINRDRADNSLLCCGDDIGVVRVWDIRDGRRPSFISCSEREFGGVTSVCFDNTGTRLIGGVSSSIAIWDMRSSPRSTPMKEPINGLVTGLAVSPDGSFLLSNSQDNALRMWDIRTGLGSYGRCLTAFYAHKHDRNSRSLLRCAWSSDGTKVSAGSSNGMCYVWNTRWSTPKIELPGHEASVNDVDFHPTKLILCTGSSDKQIYLEDLSSELL